MSQLSFKDYLVEAESVIYITFGRMNPPTIGHEKLLDVLAKKAKGNPYRVYLSQTQDKKKNPLGYEDKVKYARKMFPKHARQIILDKTIKTFMDVLVKLHKENFKKVVMVVGSDRINEFQVLSNKYNGVEGRHGLYNFQSIDIVSAGNRDPDSKDVDGMSASKQRKAATENDYTSFQLGVSKHLNNSETKNLFNDIRTGMGLKEQTNFMSTFKFDPISEEREQFVNGELFTKGDDVVIKESSQVCTVSHVGTNYVIVEMHDGSKLRKWINDIEVLDK